MRRLPRVLWKMAWRDIRRDPRQWTASVTLIAMAVAAGVVTAAWTISAERDSGFISAEYLGAQTTFHATAVSEPREGHHSVEELNEGAEKIVATFGEPTLTMHGLFMDESAQASEVSQSYVFLDFRHPLAGAHSPLVRGRLPAEGEVMVGEHLGLDIGGVVLVPGLGRREVVGIFRSVWWHGIVSPEHMVEPPEGFRFFEQKFFYAQELSVSDGSRPFDETGVPLDAWYAQQAPIDDRPLLVRWAGVLGAGVTVATSLFVVLIVGAVFVVRLRAKLRVIGLLAGAGGGEARHAFFFTLLSGALIGMTASVLGGALGAIIAGLAIESNAVAPLAWFNVAPNADPAWVRIEYLAPMIAGLGAAVLASSLAAVQAKRMPVLSALNSAVPSSRPWRFSGAAAVALLLVGFIFVALGSYTNEAGPLFWPFGPLFAIAGLALAGALGMFSVAGIAALSHSLPQLSFWLRMAVRDANRHRSRSALAAVSIASLSLLLTGWIQEVPLLGPIAISIVVGMFVSLALSEVEGSTFILTASGGGRHTRRKYAAATAVVMLVSAMIPALPTLSLLSLFDYGNSLQVVLVGLSGWAAALLVVPAVVAAFTGSTGSGTKART